MIIRKNKSGPSARPNGFSLVEVLVVAAILAIVTTLALIGVNRARGSFVFSNAVGSLQSYLEKGISDARRRNARGTSRSEIAVVNANSFQVKIDFDGNGTPETRTIPLPDGVTFIYTGTAPKATIDWRGQIAEGNVSFMLRSPTGQISEVRLTGRGDASTDAQFPTLPTVSVTPLSGDVKPTTVLVGNTAPTQSISPTPTPTPLPFCTGSQKPAENNCRCPIGKIIDKDGKCK